MTFRSAVPSIAIVLAAAALFLLLGRSGCDRRLAEPDVKQLLEGATGAWIGDTGLRVRRAEGFRLSGSTIDLLYVMLEHPAGTNAGVIEAIERWVEASNARRPNPIETKTSRRADLANGVRGYVRRNPPSWWLAGRVEGTVVSLGSGPELYVPDAGPRVYLVYAVP